MHIRHSCCAVICFACFALLAIFFSTQATAATIEGIAFTSKGPLAGAVIEAYPDALSLAAKENAISSAPGEKVGSFTLTLPAGRYYFTASGSADGYSYSSYHGMNPIIIDQEYRWLPFFTVLTGPVKYEAGSQGIGGHVTYHDAPVTKGIVSVYAANDKYFRGMGLLTNSLDDAGKFWFDLEPGNYVVIARSRHQGSDMGPLKKGDLFCYPPANPVAVAENTASLLEVPCYPRDDLNDFLTDQSLDPRGRRETQRRGSSYHNKEMRDAEGIPDVLAAGPAKLAGQVLDSGGSPRPGLFVTAYPADDFPLFQMFVLRLISRHMATTDDTGHFTMDLPAGSYYLVAREKLGMAPDRNELYGLYEGNANHAVILEAGKPLDTIVITVDRIMP